MVRLNGLTFAYGEKEVIANLTAAFPEKGVVAVLGPSGSGKSTLLSLLAGLLKAAGSEPAKSRRLQSTGESAIQGLDGKRIGVVFQDDRLLPWYTARQNVELVLPGNRKGYAMDMLEEMELKDASGQLAGELSGGMARRVAIARALAALFPEKGREEGMLLLDEPFTGLDDDLKYRIIERLKAHEEAGLIVVAMHGREDAKRFAGDKAYLEINL